MKPTRKLSRRSFLGRVAGGIVAGGATLTILGREAQAQPSDTDPTDQVGRGYTGVTDNDRGGNADPVGNGRGRGRITDSDSGSMADPSGNGRGRRRTSATGVTDGDSGQNADRANYGRGRDR